MPKFRKLIVTPGTHNVGRIDGTSEVIPITDARIKTWVENTNKLKALGVKVPAPFAHQDKNKNFPLPVILGTDGATLADAYAGYSGLSWDAQVNGGFWEDDFSIDPVTNGLVGNVEAPGDENDPTTQAGKIGKVVKETSVFVMGPRKVIVNGVEHEVGEHLAHVAMCLHPAQPGQRNFEPITVDVINGLADAHARSGLKLAMSFCMADLVTGAQTTGSAANAASSGLVDPTKPKDVELAGLMQMLRNVCYIDLPETTTRETLVTDLSLCLRQKSADQQESEKEKESLTQRPEGTDTKSPSIAMTTNLIPSATGTGASANTTTSGGAVVPTASDTLLALTMSNLIVTRKGSLKKRIDALVSTGRCPKQYALAKLYPRIDALAMSPAQLAEAKGDISKIHDPVEDLIEGLEQAQPLAGSSLSDDDDASWDRPVDSAVQEIPDSGPVSDLKPQESDEIIDMALASSGM